MEGMDLRQSQVRLELLKVFVEFVFSLLRFGDFSIQV